MGAEISVVVPVYNAGEYLNRCVESVLFQTFHNFEIILVDDGSVDSSPRLCDEWKKKDNRIRVIHKKNGGPADARKSGIQAAEGRYISFVDADDWLEPAFLESLYDGICLEGADIVQCNYQQIYEKNVRAYLVEPKVVDEQSIREVLIPQMTNEEKCAISNALWNKLYRAEIIRRAVNYCNASITMGEDFLLNLAAAGISKRIVFLNTPPLYNYRITANSLTGAYHPEWKFEKAKYYENLREISEMNGYCCNVPYLRNRRFSGYIFECAVSDWSRAERRKEILEIVGMLDRAIWRKTIHSFPYLPERVCMWMTYFGAVTPMLHLVDLVKKKPF